MTTQINFYKDGVQVGSYGGYTPPDPILEELKGLRADLKEFMDTLLNLQLQIQVVRAIKDGGLDTR